MLDKAIAGWLTSSGEKGYQPAFVSLLAHRGDTILYSSRHRPLEQGKDVSSRDVTGQLHAYQLKGPKIDVTTWRKIRGEIDDLVSMPIRNPSVGPAEPFRAYLVTNGHVADEILVYINEYNASNRAKNNGWAHLEIIQGDELLKLFQEMGRSLLPVPPSDAKVLFNTYCSDGTDLPTMEDLERIYRSLCFDAVPASKAARSAAIARSVLVASFVLKPFEEAENHVAQIAGWSSLAMGVSRFAFMHDGASDESASDALGMVWDKIAALARALRSEVLMREEFLEGDWRGDGGEVYRARMTIVAGIVSAIDLLDAVSGDCQPDACVCQFVKSVRPKLWLWGEGAIPFCICCVKRLELAGEHDTAKELLASVLVSLVKSNRVGGTPEIPPLPSPYLSAEDVLLDMFEMDISKDKLERDEFVGTSYMLHTLVFMCARRGMRDTLADMWPDIARMRCAAFEPDDAKAFCEWRTEQGTNRFGGLEQEQSWATLVQAASGSRVSQELVPLWGQKLLWVLLAAPHRWREPYGSIIDASL